MIPRTARATVETLARGYPVVALTGPRQSGKTTLARAVFPDKPYVSLEDLDERDRAQSDPRAFLDRFPGGAVLDEVQRAPDLFSYLQTRVDRQGEMGLFVLTGSQQFGLLANVTQTLAGRVALVQLLPFTLDELAAAGSAPATLEDLLFQGLYPPIHDRRLDPAIWFGNYVATYVERDVRQLVNVRDLSTFQRFLRMCATRTGQLLNLSGLAADCGITHHTAQAWISVLEASYVVHLVRPHHANFGKRLVKTPKLYFCDPGLAAWLANVPDVASLAIHPLRGPLFETWVVAEMLKARFNRGLPSNLSFWRDRSGHEVDLLLEDGDRVIPIEIKSGQTVAADAYAGLERWHALAGPAAAAPWLVYGGTVSQTRKGVELVSWREVGRIAGGRET